MTKATRARWPDAISSLSRRLPLLAGLLLVAAAGAWLILADAAPPRDDNVVVTMSPWCGCCGEWVDYMQRAGFTVEVVETEKIEATKRAARVPEALYSCHTAEIAGYVVEGHVPLTAIDKLLSERPAVDGIALAGMPPGSPGMGGERWASYPVDAFADGHVVGRFLDATL
jgi:hypothetical protein